MRAIVAVVVFACGCSVDIGAGSIAPVAIDAPIDGSSTPPLSLPMEVEFLSADQSKAIADQYGGKLGAVTAIDVSVQALAVTDGSGAPVTGGVIILGFEGITVEKVGDRVRLPDATRQKVLAAIAARAALDVSVQATIGWATPSPPAMGVHAVLQPIVVVDGLKAL